MTVWQSMIKARRHAKRGQMMAIFALSLTVFVGAMMLGVDLSRLRTEAERIQHAANAAALAGVVFLPDYIDSADYRANEEAAKNGFHDGQNGVTITSAPVPGYNARLKVTITEPASLIFGGALGLGPQTISRSATAEYAQPLQMGAPDYVLGYAPFPTNMVTQTVGSAPTAQGFYLEARGPYGQQENGDAYSQYYESYSSGGLKGTGNDTDPCPSTSGVLGGCTDLTANPDLKRIGQDKTGFTGYDFVVDNPITQNLVIKIFDPYDEGALNQDDTSTVNPAPGKQSMLAPYNWKFSDQWGCTVGGTKFCVNGSTPVTIPVNLQFTLSGPYQTLYDTTPRPITTTPTTPVSATIPGTSSSGSGLTCSGDCVVASPFNAGDDPTHTMCQTYAFTTTPTAASQLSCYNNNPSPYAYKFLNYAIIRGQGLYHIHVQTTVNVGGIYDGKYGTGGNTFGLAACADPLVLGSTSRPAGVVGNVAIYDPSSGTGTTYGWNPSSCSNPNATITGCANPGTAPVDQCVHIFAVDRMCIFNNLASSSTSSSYAIVPLGYVPPDYAGQHLQVHLYDVGDISGSSTNGIEVLTPAGDATHHDTTTVSGFATSLPYSWSVAPTDSGSGYHTNTGATVSTAQEYSGPSGDLHYDNGAWLNIDTLLPSAPTYPNMVSQFGGYWKMLYDIGAGNTGQDTTTWEIGITGAPVHLVG